MKALSEDVRIQQVTSVTEGAAGAADITGDAVDMAQFEAVQFLIPVGTIVAGAATSFKLQQDSDSAFGTAADIAGSKQTIADTDDDTTFYSDLIKPTKRYVRIVVSRATQNSTFGAILALQYGAKKTPVTNDATFVTGGESYVSPAEGTA